MIGLLIFISSYIFAQDQSVEEYCFTSPSKAQEVAKRSAFILLPSDKTQLNDNCLSISTLSHRRELLQNFIRNLEPNVSIKFSSAEARREPCKIKVEKTYTSKIKNNNAQVWPTANLENTQANGVRTETSQISTIKGFELQAYENQIKGECRYINPSLYEIKLEATKLAKPLPPAVVLGHNPELLRPQDEKLNYLSTTVQLHRGEKMHLGSVLKKSELENSHIKTMQASGSANQASETEDIYLSIE